jgi:3-deoxy-D-arabino-heptulosonate 7-phosphate (DAHP) synthase class II
MAMTQAEQARVVITERIMGIYHMQVCCVPEATDEEILAVCNQENPSGTTGGWTRVYRLGINQPTPCADDPQRRHVLVAC